jgi:hypothetical protein
MSLVVRNRIVVIIGALHGVVIARLIATSLPSCLGAFTTVIRIHALCLPSHLAGGLPINPSVERRIYITISRGNPGVARRIMVTISWINIGVVERITGGPLLAFSRTIDISSGSRQTNKFCKCVVKDTYSTYEYRRRGGGVRNIHEETWGEGI